MLLDGGKQRRRGPGHNAPPPAHCRSLDRVRGAVGNPPYPAAVGLRFLTPRPGSARLVIAPQGGALRLARRSRPPAWLTPHSGSRPAGGPSAGLMPHTSAATSPLPRPSDCASGRRRRVPRGHRGRHEPVRHRRPLGQLRGRRPGAPATSAATCTAPGATTAACNACSTPPRSSASATATLLRTPARRRQAAHPCRPRAGPTTGRRPMGPDS